MNFNVDNVANEVNEDKSFLNTSMILKINAMNQTMEKLNNEENQAQIDKIFQLHPLRLSDYEVTNEEPRKFGVTKWVNVKNNEIFAFKRFFDIENPRIIQNKVAIFKELH